MEQSKIDRINFLAKKSKEIGLTAEEIKERDSLRREYIAAFRQSLQSGLDQIYIVDEDGTKHKLQKKD